MFISYLDEMVFFHNPKTAGSSISYAVFNNRKMHYPDVHFEDDYVYPHIINYGRHICPKDFKTKMTDALSQKISDEFFKIAFIRNPWDRVVSQYHWNKKYVPYGDPFHQRSFNEWVKILYLNFKEGVCDFNIFPQHTWTHLESKQYVDFIGRYESLASDFSKVAKILNIPSSLDNINASDHRPYQSYYDEETSGMVAGIFTEDIDLFGYIFDG